MLIAGVAAASASCPEYIPAYRGENLYMNNMPAVDQGIIQSILKIASVAAAAYCHSQNRAYTAPKPDHSFVGNFLLMAGHVDPKTQQPDPRTIKYIEKLWILTADHEMTHSTAAFLHAASSLNDPLMSCIAGFASSWGILHGGAIEMAYQQFERCGSFEAVPALLEKVKTGQARLYGYGHRLYRVPDPRHGVVREILEELAADGKLANDKLLSIALEVDRLACVDDYFTKRGLHANFDLLASFVYKALLVILLLHLQLGLEMLIYFPTGAFPSSLCSLSLPLRGFLV